MSERIRRVEGRACVLRGNDIDTDRIIPARFLRCVTFDGLGAHAFEDDRKQAAAAVAAAGVKSDHPLDDPRFAGARLLVVGANFGCGSSREHAPQSLMRAGFRAFIGESFAEIFVGNCSALGLPCATLEPGDLAALMDALEGNPAQQVVLDIGHCTLRSSAGLHNCGLRDGVRAALLEGNWNATRVLLEAGPAIERTANALPYLANFARR